MAITIRLPSGECAYVDADTALIGTDATCQVRLPSDGRVQPQHARVRRTAGRWLIESTGEWHLRVGNGPEGRLSWLQPGDVIRLAEAGPNLTFETAMPTAPPQRPAPANDFERRRKPESELPPSDFQTTCKRDTPDWLEPEPSHSHRTSQPRSPSKPSRCEAPVEQPTEYPNDHSPDESTSAMDKPSKDAEEKKPDHTVDRVGSYIFGSLLFIFFVGVFVFSPETLPEFKQRMLAISSALLAGIFTVFMTGSLSIRITSLKSPLGKVAIRAGGGMGVFVLVMVWWLSPLAPVKAGVEADETLKFDFGPVGEGKGIMGASKDAKAIYYSFDGTTWKPADNFKTQPHLLFKGFVHVNASLKVTELAGHDKVFLKIIKANGEEGGVQELTYDRNKMVSPSRVGQPFQIKTPELPKMPKLPNVGSGMSFEGKDVTEEDFKNIRLSSMVNLSDARFDEDNLKYLNGPLVEVIILKNTKVTDKGVKLFSPPLLRTLDLANTLITDETLKRITGFYDLKDVDVSSTNVTDAGVDFLVKGSGPRYISLRKINLKDTKITIKSVEALKKRFKSCEVISSLED